MTNGGSLTLVSLNGSAFTIDAGTADFHLEVDGDLRQEGSQWLYNGRGSWAASGGIGLAGAPVYVTGLESQVVNMLGVAPAYFFAVRPDGSALPVHGGAVNGPGLEWAGRAQVASSRQATPVDVGSDTRGDQAYRVVGSGIRLPDDQQPPCDPDLTGSECEQLL